MLQGSQRTALSGPALIRLLARLAELDVPESRQSLSDRLSQWLGWTDAIALSTALSGAQTGTAGAAGAAVAPGGKAARQASGGAGVGSPAESQTGSAPPNPHDAEAARVRTSLVRAVAGDSVLAPARPQRIGQRLPPAVAPDDTATDFALFRQRHASIQQSMEIAVGNLRGRLRSALAATSPASAQLAVLDAVMERALAERERALLATVPGLLAAHFERLRAADGAWLDIFRKDLQSVLLAELDVRFQPVEGLLDALRAC
jgi:hypothetical protein